MANKVAVVNSKSFGQYFPEHLQRLNKIGGVDILDIPSDIDGLSLAKQLEQYEYLIPSVTPVFNRVFFENSPNLKLISRHGLGYNNIDLQAATEHDVLITKVIGPLERNAVGELAVGMILAQLRWIVQADNALKTNKWDIKAKFFGRELHDTTVGIIGFGNIGSRVGEILNWGFGTKVLAYDPFVSAEEIEKSGGIKVELDELLKKSDIISLNSKITDSSFEIINKEAFSKMKDGVLITNTARGALVNLEDLIEALESRKVGSYATDVYLVEPIEIDNPLKKFENVILLPHIAAYTDISLEGMGNKVVTDVEDVVFNRTPKGIVNEEILIKKRDRE